MKKYVKPDLVYESFELSMGVAACTDLVFNKDGSVKTYDETDGAIQVLKALSYFGSDCTNKITVSNYANYFGGVEDNGFAFNS